MRTVLCSLSLMTLAASAVACAERDANDGAPAAETSSAASACSTRLAIASVAANGAEAGNPASQAVDSNEATRWSDKGVGSSITADLGASKSVCGVSVAWYQGATRTNSFSVSVSADGGAYATVYTGHSSGKTAALEATTFAATNARYVRVTVNGNTTNDWASIDELQVDGASTAAAGFVHPGVQVSGAQLSLVKAKVAAGAQPWKRAFDELAASKYVRSGWTAKPPARIACGGVSAAGEPCTDENDDAAAAYGNALMWAYTGVTKYADTAIGIFNAYANTVTSQGSGGGATGWADPRLESAWAGARFAKAAEILRYTTTRWPVADAARFGAFLRNVYLPLVENGWPYGNGNWELSMVDASASIAVFTDDRATFDKAVALWKSRVPAYIYRTSDGALPVRPSGTSQYASESAVLSLWEWPTTGSGAGARPTYPFPDGVAQETCRDFNHTTMGMTSMIDTAETAHVQGIDLYSYSDFAERIPAALEFHSKYLSGAVIPTSLCGGEGAHRGNGSNPTVGFLTKAPYALAMNFEVGYNHYANRLGMSLPQTRQALAAIDANGSAYRSKVGPTAVWENLSNAEK